MKCPENVKCLIFSAIESIPGGSSQANKYAYNFSFLPDYLKKAQNSMNIGVYYFNRKPYEKLVKLLCGLSRILP